MIELVDLEYKENLQLDLAITKFANCNLEEIIHYVIDLIEETGDRGEKGSSLEWFSPPKLYVRSTKECYLRVKDLHGFTQDTILHKDLSPVYQFTLFHIIDTYIEIFSETETGILPADKPLIINEMPSELKQQVIKQYGRSAVLQYSDIKGYLERFFWNWDFQPSFLAGVVQLFVDKSPFFYSLTSVEELDEYVELMDDDTLYKYTRAKAAEIEKREKHKSTVLDFHTDLTDVLSSIQSNPAYWNLSEDGINDCVRDMLNRNYTVLDQTRQGVSESGDSTGEVDLIVRLGGEPVAIIEALKLDSLKKEYLDAHIHKLLVNYDPLGFQHACLVVYAYTKNFSSFYDSFFEHIQKYAFPYPVEGKLKNGAVKYTEQRNAHILLRRSGMPTMLSFYIINLRTKETS